MTLTDFFWALGDIFYFIFLPLEDDFWLTSFMNTGILILGFIGLFYWLNIQRKLSVKAENDPNQLK